MADRPATSSSAAAPNPHPLDTPLDLVLLSIVAGSADAAGYLGLGKVFTANMTGNIVLLGIALSEGRSGDTGRSLAALFAFIAGTCLGGWMCRRVTQKQGWAPQITRVISLEAVLLLAFAILTPLLPHNKLGGYVYPLIGLLGLSMGLQGAAAFYLGIPGIVTTVVTGTLTSLFIGLTKIATGTPTPASNKSSPPPPLLLQATVVVTYCGGAATSGLLMLHARPWAGFFPTAIVVIVILTRVRRPKRVIPS
jgi:uncharacterized membrane protein YoaK (UPF0700 family)